jgi:hypothetical protein
MNWFDSGNRVRWYQCDCQVGGWNEGVVVGVDDFWIKKEGVRYVKVEMVESYGWWGKFEKGFVKLVRFVKGMGLKVLIDGVWKNMK